LIERCSNPGEPYYESSWELFHERYSDFIFAHVRLNCRKCNAGKLDRPVFDTVNDIQAEVYAVLVRKLGNVLYKDDERRFLAWLVSISRQTTRYFIKKYSVELLIKNNSRRFMLYLQDLDDHFAREYYDDIAEVCRKVSRRKNLERDLAVFQLCFFAGFDAATVRSHPCFSGLTDRAVELAVSRITETLLKNREYLLNPFESGGNLFQTESQA
jgi:hypothetical protein